MVQSFAIATAIGFVTGIWIPSLLMLKGFGHYKIGIVNLA